MELKFLSIQEISEIPRKGNISFVFAGEKLVSARRMSSVITQQCLHPNGTISIPDVERDLLGEQENMWGVRHLLLMPHCRKIIAITGSHADREQVMMMLDPDSLNLMAKQELPHEAAMMVGVTACTVSTDECKIFTGGFDESICAWDADNLQPLARNMQAHEGYIMGLASSGDCKIVFSIASDARLKALQADTLEIVCEKEIDIDRGRFGAICSLTGDQRILAAGTKELAIWEVKDKDFRQERKTRLQFGGSIMKLSSDSKFVVLACNARSATCIEVRCTDTLILLARQNMGQTHPVAIQHIAISPDDSTVIVVCRTRGRGVREGHVHMYTLLHKSRTLRTVLDGLCHALQCCESPLRQGNDQIPVQKRPALG